jgi:uncharacterized protein YlxW (UPF0749 family)
MSERQPDRRHTDELLELFRSPLEPGYAEAARRRREQGPPPSWSRLAGRGGRYLALALIGFLLAVAYQHAVAAAPETTRVRNDLLADIRERQAQTDALQHEAERLRIEVGRERDAALAGESDAERLRGLEAGTGLARVTGDGVVVRVADGPAPVDPVTGRASTDNPGAVLDRDLQDLANALWRAGAEAIAINGHRLTGTATIRAAGGAILVGFRPVTSPYELSAIGPEDLQDAFEDSPTAKRFKRYVDTYRMQFSVRERADLLLPAAPNPPLRFARPPSPSPSGSSAAPTSPSSGTAVPSPPGAGSERASPAASAQPVPSGGR